MAFGRLGALGVGFGRLGGGGRNGGPAAPVLSLNSEVAGLVSLKWDIADTVAAGDVLRRQAQVSGGNWSSLIDNTDHTISSPEDTANQIAADLTLSNGTYDIRGFVIKSGRSSASSNVLTITISDATTGRLMWSTDQLLWSIDHLTWA